MHNCVVVYQFLKVILIKNYKDTASHLPVHIYQLISCFTYAFTSADIIFYKFLELGSTLSEKYFPHLLDNQISLDLYWFWYQNIKLEGHCQVILIWLAGQFQSHVGLEMSGMSL